MPTIASDGDAVAASSLDALARLAREAGRSLASFEVIGAGVPGWVRAGAGTVSHAVNLGVGPEPVALATRLTAATGVPAFVENDVNAAAFGAATLLAADDLAYLSVGTGLAAGLILGGALRRGAHGVVGEIGHLPVVAGGPALRVRPAGLPRDRRRRARPSPGAGPAPGPPPRWSPRQAGASRKPSPRSTISVTTWPLRCSCWS